MKPIGLSRDIHHMAQRLPNHPTIELHAFGTQAGAPVHFDEMPQEIFFTGALCLERMPVPAQTAITIAHLEAAGKASGVTLQPKDAAPLHLRASTSARPAPGGAARWWRRAASASSPCHSRSGMESAARCAPWRSWKRDRAAPVKAAAILPQESLMSFRPLHALLLPLLAMGFAWPGQAQQARTPVPPPTPVSPPAAMAGTELPDRTQATFGDWLMRCDTQRPAGQPVTRVCEVAIAMNDQRGQPIAQIVLGRATRNDPYRMLVQLPLEMRVDLPARLLLDPAAPPAEALSLPFRLCSASRGGCFGEMEAVPATALTRIRARADNQGRLDFRDSAGREVQILFSFRGFGQAMDALARETGG